MNISWKLVALAVLGSISLSGCSQRYLNDMYARQERDRQEKQARYRAFLESKCDSYGFKRNTPEYAQCLQLADQATTMQNTIQNAEAQRQQQQRAKAAQDLMCSQDLACRATRR